MINLKLIYKIIGSLLFIEAMMLLLCLGVSVYYHEDDLMAFALSVAISAGTGLVLRLFARNCDNTLSRRDAYLVVTLTWTVFSLFGTLPFLLGGYLHSFTDAFFETMSGFTTTGATIIDDVDVLPHGILFWRTWYCILHDSPSAFACRRKCQGVRRRSNRTDQDQASSAPQYQRQVDMGGLHLYHNVVYVGYVVCRYGLVQ